MQIIQSYGEFDDSTQMNALNLWGISMDQRVKPSARIQPLPPEHSPELREQFESMRKNLGFIPNSILIMQRKPKMAKALAQMTASIWDPEGKVDRGLKRL